MPTAIYEEDDIKMSVSYSLIDAQLDKTYFVSNTTNRIFPANERFNGIDLVQYTTLSASELEPANSIRICTSFTDASGAPNPVLASRLLGFDIDFSGIAFSFRYFYNNSLLTSYDISSHKPNKSYFVCYDENDDVLYSSSINLNDFSTFYISGYGNALKFSISAPPVSLSSDMIYRIDIFYEFDLPIYTDSFNLISLRTVFPSTQAYVAGFYDSVSSSTSQDDYNKNVEAELGNINTGIGNVVNGLTNLGNQAVQNTQNIINSVSQMTTNISNVIDQQRQDILNGLGLLGDNLSTELGNVKTEITNMSSNIVGKLESITETITNTIETKVDEVTTAVEDVKSSILDLPNKIQEMLIGLVVPNEETINAKYAEFDELLSSRFGLIYQSADIIHDFADSFQTQAVMTADTGGIITMPSVTVNLAGTQFTFGGYEVDIIPNGFEFLQQALRLAISMVCTVVFVNMCKNKLEAILK